MTTGKQWLAVAIPLGAGLAMVPAVLSGELQWLAVLPAVLVLLWALRSPFHCLLLTVFAFPFERVGNIPLPWFKIKPFQLLAGLTLFALLGRIAFGRKRFARLPRHPILFWLAGFYLANLVSYFFSQNPDDLRPLSHYALFVAIAALVVMLVRTPEELSAMVWTAVLSGAFAAVYGLLQYAGYLSGWDTEVRMTPLVFSAGTSAGVRVVSLFYDPNLFASFLCPAIPLGLACCQAAVRRWQRLLAIAAVVVMLLAMAATYSRSGFLGVVAALLCFVLLQRRLLTRVRALVLIALFVALGWSALRVWGGEWIRPDTVWGRALAVEQGIGGRTSAWQQILGAFYDHPVVGLGPAEATNWGVYIPNSLSGWDMANLRMVAHNNFLDVMVGAGLVGLVPFVFLVGLGLLGTWRGFRRSDPRHSAWKLGALLAMVSVVANGMSMSTLSYPSFWFVLGLAVATEQTSSPGASSTASTPSRIPMKPRWAQSQL